jgi:hypothetical protein
VAPFDGVYPKPAEGLRVTEIILNINNEDIIAWHRFPLFEAVTKY